MDRDDSNADLGSLDNASEAYSISSIAKVDESICSIGQQNSIFKIRNDGTHKALTCNMYFLPTNERTRKLKMVESKLGTIATGNADHMSSRVTPFESVGHKINNEERLNVRNDDYEL